MADRRPRMQTPRKDRLWTTSACNLDLDTALQREATAQIGVDFRLKTGREFLKSDTLAHTWVKGGYSQDTIGDAGTENVALGIGFFPRAMLFANLPQILLHEGDWQLHDARALREVLVAQTPMQPPELSYFDIESAGQRSVPSAMAYEPLFVAAIRSAPSAGLVELRCMVTCLWLISG